MFEINIGANIITISGKGNGHGVGFCQWGAIAQSRLGTTYKEILAHYFPGTEVTINN